MRLAIVRDSGNREQVDWAKKYQGWLVVDLYSHEAPPAPGPMPAICDLDTGVCVQADDPADAVEKITEIIEKDGWMMARFNRDLLLRRSDWTHGGDSPLDEEGKAEWAIFRQKLRDIPQDYSNHEDIDWPYPPGVKPQL